MVAVELPRPSFIAVRFSWATHLCVIHSDRRDRTPALRFWIAVHRAIVWYINAIWFRLQRVSRHGKCPASAAAADVSVFAVPTLTLKTVRIAKGAESRMILIDVHYGVLRKSPAAQRQKTGWINLSLMAHEHDPLTISRA